ncbi:unnamed protein product, partial [Mesorhabditis spiculigera]
MELSLELVFGLMFIGIAAVLLASINWAIVKGMSLPPIVIFCAILALTSAVCPAVEPNSNVVSLGPAIDGTCSNGLLCLNDPRYGDYCYRAPSVGPCVSDQCPAPYTCILAVNGCYDLSGGDSCKDKDPNCALYLKNGYCRSKLYTPAEKRDSCCKTCGFDTACQDADPNCPLYENNSKYCNSSTSSEAQKISTCRKTCGVCY